MTEKNIISVELSHEEVPIHIRELVSLNDLDVKGLLEKLKNELDEVFILSTCNRFSIYTYSTNAQPIINYFKFLGDVTAYLNVTTNTKDSVKRLFETAAGLRSQVLGEHQIIGQIKKAYELAKEVNTLGPIMDEFIRHAISAGKRARTETNIGKHSNSLPRVTFDIIEKNLPTLSSKKLLIIGTGKMASLSASIFNKSDISEIFVASHNYARAVEFSCQHGTTPIAIEDIMKIYHQVDVVIGGTHSEVSLFQEPENTKCVRSQMGTQNSNRERIFIDLGMPRNFNPILRKIEGIKLFDLDDIKKENQQNNQLRVEEIPQVNTIIKEECKIYKEQFGIRKIAPSIGAYWNKLEEIKKERLDWLTPKMQNLDPLQMELIQKFAHHLIRDVSRDIFKGIRDEMSEEQRLEKIKSILELNNINLNQS